MVRSKIGSKPDYVLGVNEEIKSGRGPGRHQAKISCGAGAVPCVAGLERLTTGQLVEDVVLPLREEGSTGRRGRLYTAGQLVEGQWVGVPWI